MEKFNAISTAHGIKFHPIIFETTGRVHSESFRFFKIILRNISGYMDGKLLQAYWLNRISCSYQQQVAISIRDILRKQKGYRFIMGNFENNPEIVLASCSVFLARY
jgi:succinate dehydrogenase/fumarate reductase flavoprotein subunit